MIEPADRLSPPPPTSAAVMLDRLPTRLLYVEDDNDLREMMACAFIDAGFEVTAISSAEEALEKLDEARYDAILTDYNLIGETGAWLLRNASARGHLERTAALVLTSERKPAGVEGYRLLRKPADLTTLLAVISEAVGELLPAPVVRLGAPLATELELLLYVTSGSQDSLKAIRNIHRALKPYDKGRYRLTIIDVAHGGDEEWFQNLEQDRVIVTPTLVKRTPAPKTWIIGSLSPGDAVGRLLESALGERGDD